MKKLLLLLSSITLVGTLTGQNNLAAQPEKARVIAMTDGEIDDRSSMVRFLLYTNDIELVAIIQTSTCY